MDIVVVALLGSRIRVEEAKMAIFNNCTQY